MLKLVQVLGFRIRSVRCGPVWRHHHHQMGLTEERVSCSSACCVFQPKHQGCNSYTRECLRFYSTKDAQEARVSSKRTVSEPYSTVDPHKEEEFVFLEFSDTPEEEDTILEETKQIGRVDEGKPQKNPGAGLKKTLEMQLRSLQDVSEEKIDVDSHIEFHDEGFPLARYKKKKSTKEHKTYGNPDADMPASDVSCSGCGAVMHCLASDLPGYLPSEKYKRLLEEEELDRAICQRCFLLTHHQKALSITMPKEEYVKIVSRIRPQKALVLLIVDLLDLPDSIVPDLLQLVGKNKHVVILGNKADLLPADSQNYLQRIKRQLLRHCEDAGVPVRDPKDVHLISAKTGYGIENLITGLQTSWKYTGDVYLVGTANAGKSTLFNTLLESDYCKSRASDVIHKATISPWPGTTLNLLKFPIINPTPYRLLRRAERLRQVALQTEEDLEPEELQRIQSLRKQGYLIGRVGRTFRVRSSRRDLVEFDPDALSFGEDPSDDTWGKAGPDPEPESELSYNEIKDAHWFYDTPGIMKDQDILSLLTEKEVKLVVPTHAITPRTFVLSPGMVLFLGALARIDYLQGNQPCWFTVVASSQIPVHISSSEKADAIYQKHAGNQLLAVPMGGEERMKRFPPLVSQDFQLEGRGIDTAVTDIKLSSAGWVAVTAADGERLLLRAHAPQGAGVSLRNPPLLPHIVTVKGPRIPKSPAYRTKRPQMLLNSRLFSRPKKK